MLPARSQRHGLVRGGIGELVTAEMLVIIGTVAAISRRMADLFGSWAPHVLSGRHFLASLCLAAALGAALGVIRPVRREIIPRAAHVIHAQILLSIVGAMIMIVVAESLARAFAIVGAAGLVRYRARIQDPKDAGVMLVSLAVGLSTGAGLWMFAAIGTFFVIAVLWLLESLEPPMRSRFELTITTAHREALQGGIEYALHQKGVTCERRPSPENGLRYEVSIPFGRKIKKLTKLVESLDPESGITAKWTARPEAGRRGTNESVVSRSTPA
jgi:uncharacterized membrane protein YhiD involved in acid resistance